MSLASFNVLEASAASDLIRPCVDNDAWVNAVVAARPYDCAADAVAVAQAACAAWTPEDLGQALAHHPRIGERAAGSSSEATLSRGEQAGVGITDDAQTRLLEGNRVYEEKFGRVFLIRAAGRDAEEILSELNRRLENSDDQETQEAIDQLGQIAILRLTGVLEG